MAVKKGVNKKNLFVADMSAKFRALPRTAKTGFSGFYFVFITFLYTFAYQKIQNGLKRTMLKVKIPNQTKSFQNTYFYVSEHPFKKHILVAERGFTPPPRMRTCPEQFRGIHAPTVKMTSK